MTIDNGLSTVDVRDTIPITFIGEDGLPYYVKHVNNKPRVSAMPNTSMILRRGMFQGMRHGQR